MLRPISIFAIIAFSYASTSCAQEQFQPTGPENFQTQGFGEYEFQNREQYLGAMSQPESVQIEQILENLLNKQDWNTPNGNLLGGVDALENRVQVDRYRGLDNTTEPAPYISDDLFRILSESRFSTPTKKLIAMEQNPDQALNFSSQQWIDLNLDLEIASELGNLDATAELGRSLLLGRGSEIEPIRGIELLRRAAEGGVPSAYTYIGDYLSSNSGIVTADTTPEFFYQSALDLGDTNAQLGIGRLLREKGDIAGSLYYLNQVALNGETVEARAAFVELTAECKKETVACDPLFVAIATSREIQKNAENTIIFTATPNTDFATQFAAAQTIVPELDKYYTTSLVPYLNIASGHFSNNIDDQYENSRFQYGLLDGYDSFLQFAQNTYNDSQYLLYIHGFNNSIEDALVAMARLKQRGGLPGIPVIYSWPAGKTILGYRPTSNGGYPYDGYTRDVQIASTACFEFRRFLSEFAESIGPENIVLFGHSHGAKLLHAALTDCEFNEAAAITHSEKFKSVIYAAPDIDLVQFINSYRQVLVKTNNLTVYISSKDLAIQASTYLERGGLTRLGGATDISQSIEGLELIDATDVTENGLEFGHSYVFVSREALSDVKSVIEGHGGNAHCRISSDQTNMVTLRPDCY